MDDENCSTKGTVRQAGEAQAGGAGWGEGAVIALALLLQAAPATGPWDQYKSAPSAKSRTMAINPETGERFVLENGVWEPVLGPGPHTLAVSDGTAITRFDYKTGPACRRARDLVRAQTAPPANDGRIYGPSKIKAFCVPR